MLTTSIAYRGPLTSLRPILWTYSRASIVSPDPIADCGVIGGEGDTDDRAIILTRHLCAGSPRS